MRSTRIGGPVGERFHDRLLVVVGDDRLDWRQAPALWTTASAVPNASTARSMIAAPPEGVATESWAASAVPPSASISATTALAASAATSLTTTDAPRRANSRTCVVAWCLEAHDLWLSKAAAMRPKDIEFCEALLEHGIVRPTTLKGRLADLPGVADEVRERIDALIGEAPSST